MKAIVMAGGSGKRLRPLTLTCPKPMLPLINQPVLAHILDLLKRHHFFEVIIATHYLSEQVQHYFGDGRQRGMTLRYSVEEVPLGTAGSVRHAQRYLDDEPFLVISGDIVTDINLAQVVKFHHEKGALATLALAHVEDPTQYGMVLTDDTGHIRRFQEKPRRQQVISRCVNTGIYVLEPQLLDMISESSACDFSYDMFPKMLAQKLPLYGFLAEGYWRDIGTLESYQQGLVDMQAGKVGLLPGAMQPWVAKEEITRPVRVEYARPLPELWTSQQDACGPVLER